MIVKSTVYGKIEAARNGVGSTASSLTNSNIRGIKMAGKILPNNQSTFKVCSESNLSALKGLFWSSVEKSDSCWLWRGNLNKNGYGRITVRGVHWYAHQLSWFIHHNYKSTLFILHSCDNPTCVNPKHLREGTHEDNMQDKSMRGRSAHRKLTPENAREIKARLKIGIQSKAALAREFEVSRRTIRGIENGDVWKYV